jgi:hypothetical protein
MAVRATIAAPRWAPLLLLAALPLHADDVFLKGAGQLSGHIVSRSATALEIDVGAGIVTIPLDKVARIVEGRSPLDEYRDRAALKDDDREGWRALARWARSQGLAAQAEEAWKRVLSLAPDDADANQGLGRVRFQGRWVTEEESFRAQGFVEFEGDWITPAEHDAILKNREAEQKKAESEARTREADAKAREAEARTQETAADADRARGEAMGIPMWSPPVWNTIGPGPIAWQGTTFTTNPQAGRGPQ